MLAAEAAVLFHLQPVRVIFLVLFGVVVALLALGAGQNDLHSHIGTSYNQLLASLCFVEEALCLSAGPSGYWRTKKEPSVRGTITIPYLSREVKKLLG
jgi:hypothetical protein